MITQDYINGYINALNTVQENIDHRLKFYYKTEADDCCNLEAGAISYELESVSAHLRQLKESYKQLVKELNNGNK